MKRIAAGILLCLIAAGGIAAQSLKGKTMYVAVKTVSLKSSTGFFASARGDLPYGTAVKVLQEKGSWVEVQPSSGSSVTGWVPSANLTTRRISEGSTASASADELALAGKGFNQEVEKAYKDAGSLDYSSVDAAESVTVPQQDLYDFLVEGRLAMGGE